MVKYTTPCNVYQIAMINKRWSLVQDKVVLYENIKCSFWWTSKKFWETNLATRTDTNEYEFNFKQELSIWDVIEMNWKDYKVNSVVPHTNSRWFIDNYQIFANTIIWQQDLHSI